MIGLGSLVTGVIAQVDERGAIRCGDGVMLDWHADQASGAAPRHGRVEAAPMSETAVRVPGGDAIHRAYVVDDVVVAEVENDSPEAIAVRFTLSGDATLASSRPPGAVEGGDTFVFPVPHRTALRVALADPALDVRALADWHAVVRAWDRVLDRGMRVEAPEPLGHEVDAARADLLLASPSASAFVALEEWGFDDEAIAMWSRLSMRARRAARRRADRGGVLAETHDALIGEARGRVDILPGFRPVWLGQSLAVHYAPLRAGRCSFAVRWHGARPALLWDVPGGVEVRAPRLDPSWSTRDAAGETLLAEPPAGLLAMGSSTRAGARIDEPESFT
jgi:hypothetical protein